MSNVDQKEDMAESRSSEEGFKDASSSPASPVLASESKQEHEPVVQLEAVMNRPEAVGGVDEVATGSSSTVEGDSATAVAVADANAASSRETVTSRPIPTPIHIEPLSHPAEALHGPESPTTSLISSLRSQLNLISEQSHELNTKLVSAISRSADLEDELHELNAKHLSLEKEAKGLEEEKNRWEESMNTGLLVERSQIRDEMQRLAAGLVEEERRRGSAEEKRQQVEEEVDDLTARLFDQANTMVVSERMSRVEAEARLKSTEENLAAAEAAVRDMQLHLQSLPPSAVAIAGTGEATAPPGASLERKYLASHVPYTEYISFLQHLRSLRPLRETTKIPPPLVANLLAQPFLARAITEDNDPTLRLDAAPDLNWLSRRTVTQAVISGDLIVEPVSSSSVLAATSTPMLDIGCSLCGKPIFAQNLPASPASHFGPPPMHPHRNSGSQQSRFSLKPFFNANASSSTSITGSPGAPTSPSQSHSPLASPALGVNGSSIPSTIYVFRVARSTTTTQSTEKSDTKAYPLCRSGWCLERMRATCELWHFVRTGIIHVVWHSDDGTSSGISNAARNSITSNETPSLPLSAAQVSGFEPREITSDDPIAPAPAPAPPPPPPTRKKSSWALGFKLSDKSSGGWTRGWKGSGGEPTSPGGIDSKRGSFGSLGAEKEGGELNTESEVGLGAPLEINEKEVVPAIKEPSDTETTTTPLGDDKALTEKEGERSASPAQLDFSAPTDANAEDKLEAPTLLRGHSASSLATSDEAGSFSTPKGTHQELSDDDGEGEVIQQEGEGIERERTPLAVAPVINQAETEEKEKEKEKEVTLNSPKPPPIPKRAAARNRLSQIGDGDVGSASASASRNGSEVDLTKLTENAPAAAVTAIEVEESAPPPPPLPARHPRTPNLSETQSQSQSLSQGGVGEKRYVIGDGWEEKTWRQIIKLKEEMWRARIGVS